MQVGILPSVVSMLLCRLSRRYFLFGQGKKMLHSLSYGTVFLTKARGKRTRLGMAKVGLTGHKWAFFSVIEWA